MGSDPGVGRSHEPTEPSSVVQADLLGLVLLSLDRLGIALAASDGVVSLANNEAAARMVGLPRDALATAPSLWTFVDETDARVLEPKLHAAMRGEAVDGRYLTVLRKPTGDRVLAEMAGVVDPPRGSRARPFVVSVARSGDEVIGRELATSRDVMMLVELDPEPRVLYANAAASRWMGAREGHLIGRSLRVSLGLHEAALFVSNARRVLLQQAPVEYEAHAGPLGSTRARILRVLPAGASSTTQAPLVLCLGREPPPRAAVAGVEVVPRGVARALLHEIVADERSDQKLGDAGRRFCRLAAFGSIEDALAAFGQMGLGDLRALPRSHDDALAFDFEGTDLIDQLGADGRSCHITMGFLLEAIERLHPGKAVGAETACQSRGDAACRFVARLRST